MADIEDWATLNENVVYRVDKIEKIRYRYFAHLSCKDQEAESRYDDSEHLHAWLPAIHVVKFINELNQSNTPFFMIDHLYDCDDEEGEIHVIFTFDVCYECRHKTFVHPSAKRPY